MNLCNTCVSFCIQHRSIDYTAIAPLNRGGTVLMIISHRIFWLFMTFGGV